MNLRRSASLLFTTIVLVTLGCSKTAEEEHHGHVIPEHKPLSYRDAISQLDARWAKLQSGEATPEEKQELTDIVRWLPEIAADSDLRRQQWEIVNVSARQLDQLLLETNEFKDATSDWNELVTRLENLVDDSERTFG